LFSVWYKLIYNLRKRGYLKVYSELDISSACEMFLLQEPPFIVMPTVLPYASFVMMLKF
jgi:hypothetical protein